MIEIDISVTISYGAVASVMGWRSEIEEYIFLTKKIIILIDSQP